MAEAITWTKSAHTLKFGIEGRKLIAPQTFTQRVRGDYEYNNLQGYLQDIVPDSFAERSNGDAIYYGDQSAVYWYVNDNWRIRTNLTVNLGLRYEYTTIPFTTAFAEPELELPRSWPDQLRDATSAPKNDWGPRIGFAYSPGDSGRTSIRGGAGMAYDVLFDNLGLLSLPPELSSTIDCAPAGNFPCNTPVPWAAAEFCRARVVSNFPDHCLSAQPPRRSFPSTRSRRSPSIGRWAFSTLS